MAETYGAVRVEGLTKTVKALQQAGVDAQDIKSAMSAVGEIVANTARSYVPVDTGTLQGSIRTSKAKTRATVRAGSASVPYAGVIHYGWPAHNIEPQPFLVSALEDEQGSVYDTLDEALGDLLDRANLT